MYDPHPKPCRVVFKQIPSKQKQKISSQTLNKICLRDNYNMTKLNYGQWNQLNLPNCAQFIETWEVTNLDLQANQYKDIIKNINNIKFTHLKSLQLKLNRIQSIELISNIYAPCLQILSLQSNQFSKIQPLRKSDFPNMRQIKLANNRILDLNYMSQMNWAKLQRIYLQWFFGININTDLSFMSKLMSKQFLNIWAQHPSRLTKIQTFVALKAKYPSMRFQTFRNDQNLRINQIVSQRNKL